MVLRAVGKMLFVVDIFYKAINIQFFKFSKSVNDITLNGNYVMFSAFTV